MDAARFVTGQRQWMSLRLLAMAWWFLLGEMRAYPTAAAIAVFSRYGSERRRRWAYALRIRWMAGHVAGLRAIMGLTFEVEGVEESGPGPVVIFMRHASIIDNTLPDALAARAHGMGLRYVIKRELQALGAIDIVARWIPTYLAARDSKDTEGDVAAVRKLTENFGPGTREGILIYPEGTRFTKERLAKAKKVIAERQPENAERADRLQHILPPRLGGPIAVLEETAPCDVVFCGHAGFDGLRTVGDIWRGKLVGNTIHVRFQRFPAATSPRAARTRWRGCTTAGRRWTTGSARSWARRRPRRRERGAGLPAALRRRQPVLRLDQRPGPAAGRPPGRHRQPLHALAAAGGAGLVAHHGLALGGDARGGQDQAPAPCGERRVGPRRAPERSSLMPSRVSSEGSDGAAACTTRSKSSWSTTSGVPASPPRSRR